MSLSKEVLCVISQEQYAEYQEDFAKLSSASLSVENSPELALMMIGQLDPCLIIVGMDLGEMEGIEFIAKMMKKYPDFEMPVVVLPDKGDGMPPMVHSRGKATGRSTVDGVDFDTIAELIDQAAAAAAEAAVEAAKAVPEISEALERGVVPSASKAPAAPAAPQAASAKSSKTGVIAGVIVVVLLLCGGAVWFFAFSGGDGETLAPGSGGDTPEVVEPTPPEPAAPTPPEPAAPTPPEPAAPTAEEPEEIVLPLRFASGDDAPKIKDEAELDRLVERLKGGDSKIEIAGHTSADGETVNNLQLGIQRAKRAMKLLVKRGVSADRFEIASRGERAPLADNETAEGKKLNRRVTIRIHE